MTSVTKLIFQMNNYKNNGKKKPIIFKKFKEFRIELPV